MRHAPNKPHQFPMLGVRVLYQRSKKCLQAVMNDFGPGGVANLAADIFGPDLLPSLVTSNASGCVVRPNWKSEYAFPPVLSFEGQCQLCIQNAG